MAASKWWIPGVVGGVALALSACGNADKARIAEIQRQADERVAQAERVAKARIGAAQQEMAATKAQLEASLAKTKADAEDAIRDAKAGAEQAAQDAALALTKARDAYKAEARAKLASLSEDTRDLSARAAKAPAKTKALVSDAMKEIAKLQQEIAKDITAFDTATLDTFKTIKAKLDQDLAKLKLKIQGARAKVPSGT